MSKRQIRLSLIGAVVFACAILFSFLAAVNLNQPAEIKKPLYQILIMMGAFVVGGLSLYFWKANLYTEEGKLENARILSMITLVLLIAQTVFAYASFTQQKTIITFSELQKSNDFYYSLSDEDLINKRNLDSILCGKNDKYTRNDVNAFLKEYVEQNEEFDAIVITQGEELVVFTDGTIPSGSYVNPEPLGWHIYPFSEYTLSIRDNAAYEKEVTSKVISEILTIMAASVFLTIEIMLLVLKLLQDKIEPPALIDGKKPCMALRYIRPLSFLFYFASMLPISFISVMAKDFGGSFLGIEGNVLAGIPQSSETLFTCATIFLTTVILEKKGWKTSFSSGLLVMTLGSVLSALAPNILLFIVSRACVGLGYGLCWMTFRNLAFFGRDSVEKAEGFSSLNAGLFAGINCGSVLGAVLAEKLGYKIVLVLSAVLSIFCVLTILKMENAVYVRPKKEKGRVFEKVSLMEYVKLAAFVILMITPACIIGSFLSYYLPLYLTEIGRGISDAGRAQLVYGLMIVYVGPVMTRMIAKHNSDAVWNIIYSVMLGGGLVLFGLFGGIVPMYAAALLLGFGDSFGFVSQNSCFLDLPAIERYGESMSMSVLSFIKKLAEMLGPITFAFVLVGSNTTRVWILGIGFVLAALIYSVLFVRNKKAVKEKA